MYLLAVDYDRSILRSHGYVLARAAASGSVLKQHASRNSRMRYTSCPHITAGSGTTPTRTSALAIGALQLTRSHVAAFSAMDVASTLLVILFQVSSALQSVCGSPATADLER
jgi:hypothetical protein